MLDKSLPTPTPALKQAIAEEAAEQSLSAVAEAQPQSGIQTKFEGVGEIKFLATKKLSKEITGNGIGGHDRILWDRKYRDQIGDARDKFSELCDRGFIPYLTKKDGTKQSRPLDKDAKGKYIFDPDAEEIIMVAPTAAG